MMAILVLIIFFLILVIMAAARVSSDCSKVEDEQELNRKIDQILGK